MVPQLWLWRNACSHSALAGAYVLGVVVNGVAFSPIDLTLATVLAFFGR